MGILKGSRLARNPWCKVVGRGNNSGIAYGIPSRMKDSRD